MRTLVRSESQADRGEIEAAWAELEARGRDDLVAEGVAEADISLQRSVDARYVGEGHEVQVLLESGSLDDAGLAALYERFHDVHDRTFGYAYRGLQEVELVNLRVEAVGEVNRPVARAEDEAGAGTGSPEPQGSRAVWFEGGFADCPIHGRDDLAPGARLSGPAIIEEFGSTIVVRPGWGVRVDPQRNLIMERS